MRRERVRLNYRDGADTVLGGRVGCSVVWVRADKSRPECNIKVRAF